MTDRTDGVCHTAHQWTTYTIAVHTVASVTRSKYLTFERKNLLGLPADATRTNAVTAISSRALLRRRVVKYGSIRRRVCAEVSCVTPYWADVHPHPSVILPPARWSLKPWLAQDYGDNRRAQPFDLMVRRLVQLIEETGSFRTHIYQVIKPFS